MANKANEYPDRVHCPLVGKDIADFECIETQDYAEGVIAEDTLPEEYKQLPKWKAVCKNCKYHECD